jgi:hypothetical protein
MFPSAAHARIRDLSLLHRGGTRQALRPVDVVDGVDSLQEIDDSEIVVRLLVIGVVPKRLEQLGLRSLWHLAAQIVLPEFLMHIRELERFARRGPGAREQRHHDEPGGRQRAAPA